MLNLKRLQYLDAVYQYKNFTQASEALYVSQPAISSAVQALEEELGVRLVVRSSKGVTFTYEGEQFMIWARRILSTCEAAENAMRDLAGTAEQRLRLGISHVLTNPIVPMIFSTFLREHPKAQIYLNEGSMNKHVEMVTGEMLDLAYNAFPTAPEAEELEIMCRAENIGKVSRRDVAVYVALGRTGATTVASTMIIAAMAGIPVFATGGIGGVHRGGQDSMDISADLQELAHTPVTVVCAGAKQILDIGRTLEYLETMGVPVIGNQTADFPAFFCRKSGFGVDYAAQSEAEIASIIHAQRGIGFTGGILVGNPVPEEYALDHEYMERIITVALQAADEANVHGKNITPFLLAKVKELTGGESFETNVQLALNNARCAARIAAALCELKKAE